MQLQDVLNHPFTWGLALGLLCAGFLWKNFLTTKRHLKRELKRIETEIKELQSHLSTQLKINSAGNETLTCQLQELKSQNETLRMNLAVLQTKPDKAELRQLRIQEAAIRVMREQAPGFASAWEKAIRDAETEMSSAESGFTKLIRKVLPNSGSSHSKSQSLEISSSDHSA